MSNDKGYYKTFRITYSEDGKQPTIHGGSYAVKMYNIDFVTWKKNFETGDFWVKLHTLSGKEVRLKITKEELNEIVRVYGNENVEFNGEFNE